MDTQLAQFILELVVALVSALGVFFTMKADMKNMWRELTEEKRLREEHAKADENSFHNIRGEVGAISNRVAVVEGRLERRTDPR